MRAHHSKNLESSTPTKRKKRLPLAIISLALGYIDQICKKTTRVMQCFSSLVANPVDRVHMCVAVSGPKGWRGFRVSYHSSVINNNSELRLDETRGLTVGKFTNLVCF